MNSNPKEILKEAKQKAIYSNLGKWTASTRINIGMSTCEIAAGSKAVYKTITDEIKKRKLKDIHVGIKGCVGRCHLEPTVEVFEFTKPPYKYENVDVKKAKKIIEDHILKKTPKESLENYDHTSKDLLTDKSKYIFGNIDYFKKQRRIVLRNCGVIDPESLDDYLAVRGYEALAKVLADYKPQMVIDEISKSGLRGRGGGGFPTGKKWQFVADQKSDEKFIICNADEGDPGAFMDRSTIEGDPFSVIEAMAIGGYAIGANKGIVYIRAEYPLAVERLKIAIEQAKKHNFLGNNILGTNFSFDIEMVLGAGAFVCGEETALISSIEGKRGMPNIKPPFPAIKGLFGKPTLINNVETWANIPAIIIDGVDEFTSIGTEKSKGTKVFALAGKIKNTGLIEVPMGITLGDVIYDIGGGTKTGRKFKAAQTGGPSGGCLPVQFLNTPVDYENLVKAGSIMGSGGLIVMDESDCMVDVARFFLEFCQDESCGKCTPCREGTKRMLEILNRITQGQGVMEDIDKLKELGETIQKTALCGLGQTAPNPVLATLKYFPDEFEAHIKERKCPAAVCGELFVSPCQHTCPANIDIPGYIGNIREGKVKESLALIMERNPFPSVCGRICHHPCEENCRRGKVDEPVSIMKLKRFSADEAAKYNLKLNKFKGKKRAEKIAVVGAGPAGLSCAYRLAEKGYNVEVFEAHKIPGGMLTLGIPEYRLPKQIVKQEIKRITDAGVKIKTNMTLGKNITLDSLKNKYNAVFLGVGVWKEKPLNIEGEFLSGVMSGLDFLKKWNSGQLPKNAFEGKVVSVIGGGNAAIDAARTALRLNAKEVNIIYRRTKDAMPAIPSEIHDAEKEGIKFNFLVNPVKINGSNGKVNRLVLAKMKLSEYDMSTRKKAVPTGETITLDSDIVIKAIGSSADTGTYKMSKDKLALTENGLICVDKITMQTSVNNIFSGGDSVNGGATVIEAIADGEKAAISIDKYLKGEDLNFERFVIKGERKVVPYINPADEIKTAHRPKPVTIPAAKCCKSFMEVEAGFTKKDAVFEANRCLRCDKTETAEVK